MWKQPNGDTWVIILIGNRETPKYKTLNNEKKI